MQTETPIAKACRLAGGQAKIAEKFDISVQAVSRWVRRGRPPADRAIDLEKIVHRKVTRHELRPDVFGPPKKAANQ